MPGKIIGVNDADSDGDGIPGFADGFISQWFAGDSSSNDRFVPLVLQIPFDVDVSSCQLRFTYSASPRAGVTNVPCWTPAPGNLRIWLKDGNQMRDPRRPDFPYTPGDYVAPGMYSDITVLGFSDSTRSVTLYVEGIAAGPLGALPITAELYAGADLPAAIGRDTVNVTVIRPNLDITRKEGTVVSQDQEASNGSVVQIVPQTNPGNLYPAGIFLNIPPLGFEPSQAATLVTLKLKKVGPSSSQGKIRVYRKPSGESDFSVFLDQDQTEQILSEGDLSAAWRLDSTLGGVVDLALVAELPAGTEIARDVGRISSIPADPAPGRIVFVNPFSSSPGSPYDNFTQNASHTIAEAVALMHPDDNILIAQDDAYRECGISVQTGGIISGLAGGWTTANPARTDYEGSDEFDFSQLPAIRGTGSGGPATALRAYAVSGGGKLALAGLRFVDCVATAIDGVSAGGALRAELLAIPLHISFCTFESNLANDFGGAVFISNSAGCIDFTRLTGNTICRVANQEDDYAAGMGGAIASINSTLAITNCSFSDNKAQVVSLSAEAPAAPPLGCAGGGGDIYVKDGTLTMAQVCSSGAVAGFPINSPGDYASRALSARQ